MPLDIVQTALLFSGVGAGVAKIVEIGITRLNARDTNTITLTTHMSDQSKLLFDQLSGTIKEQSGTIKDVTKERNDLQLKVFELVPDAHKMAEFEKEMQGRGLTYEDCLIILREATTAGADISGRRWYERSRPQIPVSSTDVAQPIILPPQPESGTT